LAKDNTTVDAPRVATVRPYYCDQLHARRLDSICRSVRTIEPHRQIDLSLRRGKPILFGAGALVLDVQIREMRLYFYGIQLLTAKRLRLLGT
jgi:hypothetical protein